MADVIAERKEEVLWLRLNRPERLNAYDRTTVDEIIAALREHADARVAVITGEGRAFCSGGYLANLADPDFWELRAMFTGSLELFDAIRSAPMPVIAAVNGPAFGGGNELVVVCDLAIASEERPLRPDGCEGRQRPGSGRHEPAGDDRGREEGQGGGLPLPALQRRRGPGPGLDQRRRPPRGAVRRGGALVRRDLRHVGPLHGDRQDQHERLVAPAARQHAVGPGNADAGHRLARHDGGGDRLSGEAQTAVPPARRRAEPDRQPARHVPPKLRPVPADVRGPAPLELPGRAASPGPRHTAIASTSTSPFTGESYTYAETLESAERVARGLLGAGAVPGDRLLIMLPNCSAYILAWLGSSLARMAEVPINTAYRGSFLEHQARTTSPRIALIAPEFAERFAESAESVRTVERSLPGRRHSRRPCRGVGDADRGWFRRLRLGGVAHRESGRRRHHLAGCAPLRSGIGLLHLGHDGPLQGRHDAPRPHAPLPRMSACRSPGSPTPTCTCRLGRFSTATAISWPHTPR